METREVNQAIKNNPDKFPVGYIVEADKDELIKNFDKFKSVKNYPGTPKAFAKLRELSHTIAKLADSKEKPEQQSLMQRSGDIFSELIATDLPVSGTETAFEINFIVMKFRHTIKREKN